MAMVTLAPLIGGAVGPAITGAIAQTIGWRQVLWVAAVIAIVCEIAFLFLLRETYKTVILKKRVARLRAENSDLVLKAAVDGEEESTKSAIWQSIKRPASVLFGSFVLLIVSVYGGFLFTFFYIMSTTLPDMLRDIYDFAPASTGSSFLSFSKYLPCLTHIPILSPIKIPKTNNNRCRIPHRNNLLRLHPRPTLHPPRHPKQRTNQTRIPDAPRNSRYIYLPHLRAPPRLDSRKRLSRLAPPPINRFNGFLPPHLRSPINGLRGRCIWTLFRIGANSRPYYEMFDGYVFTVGCCTTDG